MFSQVSVCPQEGGCLPHCILGHPPGSEADNPLGTRHPPSACWEIRATRGRYASNMNAFLLFFLLMLSSPMFSVQEARIARYAPRIWSWKLLDLNSLHSNYLCTFLPDPLDDETLAYPQLTNLLNAKKLRVHQLCKQMGKWVD